MKTTVTQTFPTIDGPKALPDLRHWLIHRWRTGTALGELMPDAAWVRQTIKSADLWWVEPEAVDLLAESAPTWPDDWTLDLHDLPSMSGFAVFAHDMIGMDATPMWGDGTIRLSGIMWGPVNLRINGVGDILDGLAIGSWSRHVLHEGLDPNALAHAAPYLELMSADENLPRNTPIVVTGDLFTYCGRSDWLNGTGAATPLPGDDTDPTVLASKAEDRRLLAALWAITKTPIVSVERAAIPRPTVRRSTREGLDPTVRVLRLGGAPIPHSDTPSSSGGTREYRHQWIVRPHWRWQAFGSGRSQRKLILVGPFVKGPPGAPLIGGDRVWKVVPPDRPEKPS